MNTMRRTRGAVNEVVDGLVYQRAQILTWSIEKKAALLSAHNVAWVVNFWPKLDPDLSELPLKGYLYMPLRDSVRVLDDYVLRAAENLARELTPTSTALVLCEAGKTRSVYFSALLARSLLGLDGRAALAHVQTRIPNSALKPGMLSQLELLASPSFHSPTSAL